MPAAVRIAIQGKRVAPSQPPPANLVFLVDVSGSMHPDNKLPLLQRALGLLVPQLQSTDRVSIVVYAGSSGTVLPSTPGNQRSRILEAVAGLRAGGSTNGGAGIQLAYAQAERGFVKGGINRVLLATDGDFNVGISSESELVRLVQRKAAGNIFISVLGFGQGNYNDSMLEKLADKGNGNYACIDGLSEARKVLLEQAGGTLITIARDVKLQLEFNPREVGAYRLIGYENRRLAHRDFNDDSKDAGEVGAGHRVTALYELVPRGVQLPGPNVDALRYQAPGPLTASAESGEFATLRLRYKPAAGGNSQRLEVRIHDRGREFVDADQDFQFAASVACFGMLLRDSAHHGSWTWQDVRRVVATQAGRSPTRAEFLTLVDRASALVG